MQHDLKVFYFNIANFLLVFRQWLIRKKALENIEKAQGEGKRSIMTKSTAKTGNCMKLDSCVVKEQQEAYEKRVQDGA